MKKLSTLTIIIGLSASSLLLISLIAYVERSTISTYEKNKPYLVMGEYLKNLSTKAHLWFEEAMAGDNTVNVEKDVYGLLSKCTETLKGAQAGALTPIGSFYKPTDAETIAVLNKSVSGVENLVNAARNRWEFKLKKDATILDSTQTETGEQAGGMLDQEFDASYEELQTTFEQLVAHVNTKAEADSNFLNILSWVSVVLIAITLVAFCVLIYRILYGNEKLTKEVNRQLSEEGSRVDTLTGFLEKVSTGVYDMDLDSNSELNNRLLTVRNKLRDSAQEEKQRTWSTSGLAQIGELLRANYKSATELYDHALRFIIKYTGSNQGGLFLVNDDNKTDIHLNLMACYAFERTKYITKRIDIGEGMVGQCFVEREPIYMTNVPQEYVRITSGLGGANPSALLIVPLQVNEEIVGVLELASFKSFDAHEMELVKKFAESIAATVSTVRVNEKTKYLLEQSQQQAEEMRAQEEEMRQNMEELTAIQEQQQRREKEQISEIEKLNDQHEKNAAKYKRLSLVADNTDNSVIITDVEGKIEYVNNGFTKLSGYALEEVIGKKPGSFLQGEGTDPETKKHIRENLQNRKPFYAEILNYDKAGKDYWISLAINPVFEKGELTNFISIQANVTETKMAALDFNSQINAIGLTNAVIEFDLNGHIQKVNDTFLKTMGYTFDEIKGKHHRMFVFDEESSTAAYNQMWSNFSNGKSFVGEFKRKDKNGKLVWLKGTYTVITDLRGKPYKVIKFAQDITEQKNRALDFEGQINAIRKSNAVIEFDTHGKILEANEIFIQSMGYRSKEQIVGKHHSIFITEEDQQSDEYKKFWQQIANGEFFTGEFKRKKYDGSPIWIRGSYNPIFDASGKPYKAVKFAQVIEKISS